MPSGRPRFLNVSRPLSSPLLTPMLAGGVLGAFATFALANAKAPKWNLADMKRHYETAKNQKWLQYFAKAAKQHDFDEALLLGIASRENNMQNTLGDFGHGHGIMQIDDRSFPEFCRLESDWKNPEKNILKGAEVLAAKQADIKNGIGVKLVCNKLKYTGVSLTEDGLLRTTVSSYNCGCWAYYNISTIGNPDWGSTGGDYSIDVINRREVFTRLLADDKPPQEPTDLERNMD